jgi:hypothetical protein
MKMGDAIIVDERVRNAAREYAELAAPRHKSFGRNPIRVIDDIYRGKIGEIAYCMIAGISVSLLSMDKDNGVDPGYDVVHDGLKIDVKTTVTPLGSRRVVFNPDYAACDRYAIMTWNDPLKTAAYVCCMDKTLAFRAARCHNGIWFWDFGADLDSLMQCGYIAESQ